MNFNTLMQTLASSVAVALFLGGMFMVFFRLTIKNAMNEATAKILNEVRSEFQLVSIAAVKEEEFRRRLRLLEHKLFGQTNGE